MSFHQCCSLGRSDLSGVWRASWAVHGVAAWCCCKCFGGTIWGVVLLYLFSGGKLSSWDLRLKKPISLLLHHARPNQPVTPQTNPTNPNCSTIEMTYQLLGFYCSLKMYFASTGLLFVASAYASTSDEKIFLCTPCSPEQLLANATQCLQSLQVY